jgi:hypothetical protein
VNYRSVLGKTALRELMGKTGFLLHTTFMASQTPSLKIHTFLYIKHLHSAWAADASSIRSG